MLKLRETNIRDGCLELTDQPIRINITGRLKIVIDRCCARKEAGITRDIQFRDLRAKAVSDKEEATDIRP